ncbi:hypothetical protein J6590_086778 [Homalodisca vitripennis]|nr:hypothetical protein J6590_086778 [Homalodisca vitripennis]
MRTVTELGDVSGKHCGATVKNNTAITETVSTIINHQGPHPVTMRTLILTPPQRSSPCTRATVYKKSDMKQNLDHSIESDTRIPQFTNEIFVHKSRLLEAESIVTTSCSVQCDHPPTADCFNENCSTTCDLVPHLRTTIETLEAEVTCLTMVHTAKEVVGICKPGAGLLMVVSGVSLSQGSCSMIIVGTNDIANGNDGVIFQHLEQYLNDVFTLSSRVIVIVVSLPCHYDFLWRIR